MKKTLHVYITDLPGFQSGSLNYTLALFDNIEFAPERWVYVGDVEIDFGNIPNATLESAINMIDDEIKTTQKEYDAAMNTLKTNREKLLDESPSQMEIENE